MFFQADIKKFERVFYVLNIVTRKIKPKYIAYNAENLGGNSKIKKRIKLNNFLSKEACNTKR